MLLKTFPHGNTLFNMSISDQDFREEFKPLHIPAHYLVDDSDENKIVFALAQLESAASDEVATELAKHDSAINLDEFKTKAASVLNILYEKGLIKGVKTDNETRYNLSKITHSNDGAVNPELLSPGLD